MRARGERQTSFIVQALNLSDQRCPAQTATTELAGQAPDRAAAPLRQMPRICGPVMRALCVSLVELRVGRPATPALAPDHHHRQGKGHHIQPKTTCRATSTGEHQPVAPDHPRAVLCGTWNKQAVRTNAPSLTPASTLGGNENGRMGLAAAYPPGCLPRGRPVRACVLRSGASLFSSYGARA